MSFLGEIVEFLCDGKTNRVFWKYNFKNLDTKNLNDFADKIVKTINANIGVNLKLFKNYNDTSKNEKTRNYVTFVNDEPRRREEALERILTIIVNEGLNNQLTTPDGGHIDIVSNIHNGNATFVELKMNNKSGLADTPLYALIESLKNKYLIENIGNTNCKKLQESYQDKGIISADKLIILAPIDYYRRYFNSSFEAIKNLYVLKLILENKCNVIIEFQYINIENEEWDNLINFIVRKGLVDKISQSDNGIISFLSHKEEIKKYLKQANLLDKLKSENWKKLSCAENWNL